MIPFRKFQEASDSVRTGIFQAATAADAHTMAAFMGIDYLMVGEAERKHYRPAIAAIAERPDLFPQVFTNEAVTIYGVNRSALAKR